MGVTFKTQTELENMFQAVTMAALGLDPADYIPNPDTPDIIPPDVPVRISWPQDGMPISPIDEDVTYIRVGEQDQDINKQVNIVMNPTPNDDLNATELRGRTRVIDISWVFYGPSAYDNVTTVFNSLTLPLMHDPLAKEGVYFVPNGQSPKRAPELVNGQWRNRADLQAQFNSKVEVDSLIPYITSTSIQIKTESGDTRDVNAQSE